MTVIFAGKEHHGGPTQGLRNWKMVRQTRCDRGCVAQSKLRNGRLRPHSDVYQDDSNKRWAMYISPKRTGFLILS